MERKGRIGGEFFEGEANQESVNGLQVYTATLVGTLNPSSILIGIRIHKEVEGDCWGTAGEEKRITSRTNAES